MSNNTQFPPNNGAVLNIAQIIKSVMTSAAEAEMGALYINAREATPMRITLEEMGHRQPPTPMQTDNTTALAVITKRGLQDVTVVGYFHVTLTWGITRLQKICTEPYLFPVFAGGSSSIVGNGSGSSRLSSAVHEQQNHHQEYHLVRPFMCLLLIRCSVTHDKKHSSVEATYFYIIVINNSLKNWCA